MAGLKKILLNKNVITIILLIVALVVLYFGYTGAINKETKPIMVPVASTTIPPRTQITGDNIELVEMPGSMVGDGVAKDANLIYGLYTNINATIPAGSPIYFETVVAKNQIPGQWIEELEEGERGFYLPVDVDSTLGNSVIPGSYIDLYVATTDIDGTKVFGRLLKNIKVLVVHGSNGVDTFSNSDGVYEVSRIGFGVNVEMFELLNKVALTDAQLLLVPRGTAVPTDGAKSIPTSALRDIIDVRIKTLEEDKVQTNDKDTTEKQNGENVADTTQQ